MTLPSHPEVLVTRASAVATVTLHRPEKLNILGTATLTTLTDIFAALGDDSTIRAVVLTGSGDRAFCAGGDLAELHRLDGDSGRAFASAGAALVRRMEELGKPTVAAINGVALGGGVELALGCTFRIAAEHAVLGLPEVCHGLMPAFGTIGRLVRLCGSARAAELCLLGQRVSARRALELGLVNAVAPADEVRDQAAQMAARLASLAPVALAQVQRAVLAGSGPADEFIRREAESFAVCCGTRDMKEGTRAFLEKRAPVFHGV